MGLHEWWKMKSYSKWYHYFWLMPLIAIFLCVTSMVNAFEDMVSTVINAFRK